MPATNDTCRPDRTIRSLSKSQAQSLCFIRRSNNAPYKYRDRLASVQQTGVSLNYEKHLWRGRGLAKSHIVVRIPLKRPFSMAGDFIQRLVATSVGYTTRKPYRVRDFINGVVCLATIHTKLCQPSPQERLTI